MPAFRDQDFYYTVVMRGKSGGEVIDSAEVIDVVSDVFSAYRDFDRLMGYARDTGIDIIVSNTTEAGIVYDPQDSFSYDPPHSYPGKLTRVLYERYSECGEQSAPGFVILPVELIEDNGKKLKECVLKLSSDWDLPDGFIKWINESNTFCSTLVDRIVTGNPKTEQVRAEIDKKLGYRDELADICEPFGLWVIEADDPEAVRERFPLDRAGLPVIFTTDQRPYRERKVRILNGAHTSFVPVSYLYGEDIVRDCMHNSTIRKFIDRCVYGEIIPTLSLQKKELEDFAASVYERFENPYIDHQLLSICLNSVSKWKSRCLPSVIGYQAKTGKAPECLALSFAALCEFYSRGRKTDGRFTGTRLRDGQEQVYEIKDDPAVIEFFDRYGSSDGLIGLFASNTAFWGMDLHDIPGFVSTAEKYLGIIRKDGAEAAIKAACAAD